MEFLKSIAGKVVTGVVALAVIALAAGWISAGPDVRSAWLAEAGRIAAWVGIVLVVPWLAFALIGWVARMESNRAGAVLILMLSVLEAVGLAALFAWHVRGAAAWAGFVVGVLFAAAYNLFACDWIAEKV